MVTLVNNIQGTPLPAGFSEPAEKSINETQYQEMIRRLRPEDRSEVEEKVFRVTDLEIDQLASAINAQDWHAALFTQNEYPYRALVALRKGKISVRQFATIMFYWVNFTKRNIQGTVIPLFNSD